MDSCTNCGGAIGEPGVAYGYAGKWCQCPVHPSRMYQNPSRNPLRVVPMFADPEDMERYMRWTAATQWQKPKSVIGMWLDGTSVNPIASRLDG